MYKNMQNKELIGQDYQNKEEKINIVDVGVEKRDNLPNEVKGWMDKIEDNNKQSDLMSDIYSQKKVENSEAINNNTKISITKEVFQGGFKKKISDSGRWLSEFFLRLIKIKKGKVEFRENDS